MSATTAEMGEYSLLIDGTWRLTGQVHEVRSPYDEHLVALVTMAGPAEIEAAIAASA